MKTGQRDETYADQIASGRLAKEAYFRTAAESPLRRPGSNARALSYFPVDERYRIVVPRLRSPTADDRPIALDMSDGQQRSAHRLGMLEFELHGRRLTLTGFSMGSTPPGSLTRILDASGRPLDEPLFTGLAIAGGVVVGAWLLRPGGLETDESTRVDVG